MLELLGVRYIRDFLIQRIREQQEEEMFRVYLTDSIRALGEHKYLKYRYIELLDSVRKPKHSSNRSEEEIKSTIMAKLNEGIEDDEE